MWLEIDEWPPIDAEVRTLAVNGGSLVYDPASPPPSLGGRCLFVGTPGGLGFGVRDQRPLLHRGDVLNLNLGRLDEATVIAGPVRARLEVDVDGDDQADWVCTLCVEADDGRLDNLCEGVLRAHASARTVTVELGHICIRLDSGRPLRLLVAPASHPRFARRVRRRRQTVRRASVDLTVIPTPLVPVG
jgi:predicted acyl esterase